MTEQIVAWCILAAFYIVAVIPSIGATLTNSRGDYRASWVVGFLIHLATGVIFVVMGGLVWAVLKVTG